MLVDIVIALVVLALVGLAIGYIAKAKRSGKKCIGCPYSDSCTSAGKDCKKE